MYYIARKKPDSKVHTVGRQPQLQFDPLDWELPYAAGAVLKSKKAKKKKKKYIYTVGFHLYDFLEKSESVVASG